MWKKIAAVLLVLVVVIVAAFKIFFNKGDVEDIATKVNEELDEYYLKGTMEFINGEEVRNFNVEVSYEKEENEDLFKVVLNDTTINQKQLIVRNKNGVYVLTPSLNQVYEFKGEWPLNTPKPYIYQSMLNSFKIEHEVKEVDDGYVVTSFPSFASSKSWHKQEIKFDKELNPKSVYIYDKDDALRVKLIVNEFDKDVDYKEDYFDVDRNLEDSKTTSADISTTLEDLPLYPANADVASSLKDETVANINDQTVHILTYDGDKSFTVVQYLLNNNDQVLFETVEGEMVDLINGVGFIKDNSLTCIYNGVKYVVYSDSLNKDELIEVANGMEVVSKK